MPEQGVNTGWILRAVIGVTIVAVGLSIYFGIQAKRRYERTSAEQEAELAASESKVSLACSGFINLNNGKYALYYTNSEGTFKLTDFNFSDNGELVALDGNSLSDSTLVAPAATEFSIKAIADDGTETNMFKGKSITDFIYQDSFTQATGTFELKTPSDNSSSNEVAGIWFDSLTLPVPPEGWKYAAWLIKNSNYYLIGRFTVTNQADENKTYYTGNSPKKVGEDFLANFAEGDELTDVRSDTSLVVITLEPNWHSDSMDNPFPIAIMAGTIPATTQPNTAISLSLATDSLPYCIVSKTK